MWFTVYVYCTTVFRLSEFAIFKSLRIQFTCNIGKNKDIDKKTSKTHPDCERSAVQGNLVSNIERFDRVEFVVVWRREGNAMSAYESTLRDSAVFLTSLIHLDTVVF